MLSGLADCTYRHLFAAQVVALLRTGLATIALGLLAYDLLGTGWLMLLVGWCIIGIGYSVVLTPSGRLLKRSAHAEDRPAAYAAQFALSHACWLVTNLLADWLMTVAGATTALAVLAVLASLGTICGVLLWTRDDTGTLEHAHPDLPPDHPHVHGSRSHSHPIVIDDFHPHWPRTR